MIFLLMLMIAATIGSLSAEVQQPKNPGVDLPPFAGFALQFETPVDSQKVAAGDSLPVVIEYDKNLQLETVMVAFPGGGLFLDPPFRDQILIDTKMVGFMELSALGKTASGEMVGSMTITIEVEVLDAELIAVAADDDQKHLFGPGDVSSLWVYGQYSDGVRRNITDYRTSYSVVENTNIACVTYDGTIVGISPGSTSVIVKHGTFEDSVVVTVGEGERSNNTPHAILRNEYIGNVGEQLCFSGDQSFDYDAYLGEILSEENYRWKLDITSESIEAVGLEFCITPKQSGLGILSLEVIDLHGATSKTFATVVIK